MRREQRRKPCRASTNNDHTCAIETQCHLLGRSRDAANATKIFEGEYFGWIAQVATSLLHPTRLPEVYPDEHFTGTLLEK